MPEKKAPTVFLSYSHDSKEHKQWVLELANRLISNGVQVVLDLWDCRPGDDLYKFMERGVKDADRVLMICTENYVAKANDGTGGVGYEAMIVTGELVEDLGTAKFIPLIRQTAEKPQRPTSVATRVYINLSDGADVATEFDALLRELHQISPTKPALGRSPFDSAPSPPEPEKGEGAVARPRAAIPDDTPADALATYAAALEAASANDMLRWRRIVQRARDGMRPILTAWWAKYATTVPPTKEELVQQSIEGASAFAPLTAVALAGVASCNPRFNNQTGLLEEILNPAEWQRAGFVVRVELPETGAFVYQALHGAMCLHVGTLAPAMRLARMETMSRMSGTAVQLWQRHEIVMWPQALAHDAKAAWDTALGLCSRWPWLVALFGHQTDYQAALYAYYVSLNALEYAEKLRAGHPPPAASEFGSSMTDIPPVFEECADDVKRRGYRLAVDAHSDFRALWSSMKLDESLIQQHWPSWTALQGWLQHHLHPFRFNRVSYDGLVRDILAASG